jgi:hypothetical protein
MKARAIPHVAAISSQSYDAGGSTVTLLPGDPRELGKLGARVDAALQAHRSELGIEEGDTSYAPLLFKALLVGLCWDDPSIELSTQVPDHVSKIGDLDLLKLAIALLEEFMSLESRRRFRPLVLLDCGPKAMLMGVNLGN